VARRKALIAVGYVVLGLACSYALLFLVDPDGTARDRDGVVLLVYLAVGLLASVAVGAAIERPWALALPLALVVGSTPAPDVLDQLPLWALLVVAAPFASVAIALGWTARRLVCKPNALDAIWSAIGLAILAFWIGYIVVVVHGFNPWEAAEGPEADLLAAGFAVAFAVGSVALALAVSRRRRV
jgi:hypothetical protein